MPPRADDEDPFLLPHGVPCSGRGQATCAVEPGSSSGARPATEARRLKRWRRTPDARRGGRRLRQSLSLARAGLQLGPAQLPLLRRPRVPARPSGADIVPAGIQTYQPPLLHVFHYLGLAHLPSRVFGFLLGALQGLNLPLLFLLGLRVLARPEPRTRGRGAGRGLARRDRARCLLDAGHSFGDNLVTLPALLALLIVLGRRGSRSPGPVGGRRAGRGGAAGGGSDRPEAHDGRLPPALFVAAARALWKRGRGRGWPSCSAACSASHRRAVSRPLTSSVSSAIRSSPSRTACSGRRTTSARRLTSSLYVTRSPLRPRPPSGRPGPGPHGAAAGGRDPGPTPLAVAVVALVAIASAPRPIRRTEGDGVLDTREKAFVYWARAISVGILLPLLCYFVLLG